MGLTEEVAGSEIREVDARTTVEARSRSARPGPWARRILSALRQPEAAFRDSLEEDARGMVWRPILLLALLTTAAQILGDPDDAVAAILVAPFVPFIVLATFGIVAVPIHLIARRLFHGRGTWRRTLHALLWATLPSAVLGILASILFVVTDSLGEESLVRLVLGLAGLAVAVAAFALQILLAIRFVALAQRLTITTGATSFIGGILCAAALLVTLAMSMARWDVVALALAWFVFAASLVVVAWLVAGIVVAMAWLRAEA